MNWYALHVRSNQEALVVDHLERDRIEAFYPHVLQKSRDKRRDCELKFMPGYVFSSFDLEMHAPVSRIHQVVSILGYGPDPIVIPEAEIAAVRRIVTFPKLVAPHEYLASGDRVRVKWGPLVGLEGIIVQRRKRARIVVSIDAVERSISAEVDAASLEFIPTPKGSPSCHPPTDPSRMTRIHAISL